jgi:hypothetical protein
MRRIVSVVLFLLALAVPAYAQYVPLDPSVSPAFTRFIAIEPQNSVLDVLRAERAKYGPQLDTTQAAALLDAVASKLGGGWGLLRKTGGNRCPQPGTGVDVSCDWLVNKDTGTGCDALGSGPDNENGGHTGPSTPQWCGGDPFDRNAWVAPTGGGATPPPPPPPPPPPSGAATAELQQQQLLALLQIIQRLDAQLEAQRAQGAALAAAVADLKAQIASGVKIRF